MTTLSRNYSDCIEGNINRSQGGLFLQLQHWLKILELKAEVNRERHQLLEMSDTMLSDIGITRAQANSEAQRIDLPLERLNTLEMGKC